MTEITSKYEALRLMKDTLYGLNIRIGQEKDVNNHRDYIVPTSNGTLYLKFCRDWKKHDEYAKPWEERTIYATINQDMLYSYDFDNLIICHSSGKLYTIKKEEPLKVAKLGENPIQGEKVAHIPIKALRRVYSIEDREMA